jgi:hypothetical protein
LFPGKVGFGSRPIVKPPGDPFRRPAFLDPLHFGDYEKAKAAQLSITSARRIDRPMRIAFWPVRDETIAPVDRRTASRSASSI